jgi:hypothetical protein
VNGGGAVRNTAIEDMTAWVHAAPQQVLAAAGARQDALGVLVAPHPDTVVRALADLGAQRLAHHSGAYLARHVHPGPVAFPLAGPGWLPQSWWTARRCAARPPTTGSSRTCWPPSRMVPGPCSLSGSSA